MNLLTFPAPSRDSSRNALESRNTSSTDERGKPAIRNHSAIAVIGYLIYALIPAALWYSLFLMYGWRRTTVVLGVIAAALALLLFALNCGIRSYRRKKLRAQGPYRPDLIVK